MPELQRKIILFELNEVPFRVLDEYCDSFPDSAFSRYLPVCKQFRTFTSTTENLSPWKTWPSLHRGVAEDVHLIHDFGESLQEVNEAYPPIWSLLDAQGISYGICNSLHSTHVLDNASNCKFCIPDPFSDIEKCIPSSLEPFQRFNLRLSRKSARNVTGTVPLADAAGMLRSWPKLGIKSSTVLKALGQIKDERVSAWKTTRRRSIQSLLTYDVFKAQLRTNSPALATFFSNHVAANMHRYWAAKYPGDYENCEFEQNWIDRYSGEIDFAMGVADYIFEDLVEFVNANHNYDLWLVSSMGQEAVPSSPLETQLYLVSPEKFFARLEIPDNSWANKPAMLPQFNVVIAPEFTEKFEHQISQLCIGSELVEFRKKECGFYSLDFGNANIPDSTQVGVGDKSFSLDEIGLKNTEIEDKSGTTAYHIPEGILIQYSPLRVQAVSTSNRADISVNDIAPSLLRNFAINLPGYMSNGIPERELR